MHPEWVGGGKKRAGLPERGCWATRTMAGVSGLVGDRGADLVRTCGALLIADLGCCWDGGNSIQACRGTPGSHY